MVFPEFVPPEIKILYPEQTNISKKFAHSSDIVPYDIILSMLITSGNFLIVIIGPSRDIGGNTICTLEPSESLASAIGEDTFTTLFTLLTIC